MHQRELQIILTLADRASDQLKSFQGKVERTGRELSNVGQTLTTRVSAPILGLGAVALKVAGDFELGMNNVRAVSGATGDQFEKLSDQAKDLGRTTQYTAAQASEAMGFLAMAGFKADEIFSAMPGTLELAASAQLDLGQAADIVSNILTGYGMEVEQLGRVNDVLVKSLTSTNTNLTQLGEAFKYAGPVAKSAGLEFEETAAALGLMGNGGIQASMAGTALRGAVVRLLKPTKEVHDALDELGLASSDLVTSSGGLRPLAEIIEVLEKKGANTSQMMALFGLRAGPAMEVLLSQGSKAMRELTGELENAGGTAAEIAGVQMEGFVGAMRAARSAFEGFMIALSESGFMETVAELLQKVAEKLIALAQWWENLNPKMQEAIVIFLGIVAAVGPLLLLIGQGMIAVSAFAKAFAFLVPVLKTAVVAIGAITAPIWVVIGAITAIVGTIIWWAKNWEENVETIRWVWGMFSEWFSGILENIGNAILLHVDNVKWAWGQMRDFFVDIWNAISTTFTTVVTAIGDFLQRWFVAKPTDSIRSGWEGIKDFFASLWDGIVGVFQGAIDRITDIVDRIVRAAQRARDAAREVASAAGNRVRDAVSSVGSAVGRVFNVNDAIISPKGDIISTHPEDYLIATKNPYALAGAGGGAINITITGNHFMGREGIAEEIGDAIIARLQRSRRL